MGRLHFEMYTGGRCGMFSNECILNQKNERKKTMSLIDISLPMKDAMVCWPGDPAFRVRQVVEIGPESPCNITEIAGGVHTGTHMDSMRHFIAGGTPMDEMPLEAVIGPARVLQIDGPVIDRASLEPHRPQKGERLLFKTSNSELRYKDDNFYEDYVGVDDSAAKYLVECGVRTVGLDYLSIAPWADLISTHITLLGAGVWVIEGLNFKGVDAGDYELLCLPLKIQGSDGAPCRAVLRKS